MKKISISLLLFGCFIFDAAVLSAAEYYVSSSQGNDANPGTFERPWKTIEKVNSFAFKTGDDVYLKCGDMFTPTAHLNVDWEGTAADPAVIGAYYLPGGQPVLGVLGPRPVISGSDWTVPENGYKSDTDSWKGLINIENKDHITIKDLNLYRSGFYAISIYGNSNATATSYKFVVDNVEMGQSFATAIRVDKNPVNDGVIRNCHVWNSLWWQTVGYRYTGACIAISNCPRANTLVESNFVERSWGEGINSARLNKDVNYSNSGYCTIRNNIIWNTEATGIYLDTTEGNVVYNNLILGAGNAESVNPQTVDGRHWMNAGITIGQEQIGTAPLDMSVTSDDNLIYNNLVAGSCDGLAITSWNTEGGKKIDNFRVLNNTFIGCHRSIRIGTNIPTFIFTNSAIKNNIFWNPADCNSISISGLMPASLKAAMDYNAWTDIIPEQAGGSNNIVLSATDGFFMKTSGWQTLSSVITSGYFKVKEGSLLINAGTSQVSIFNNDFWGETRIIPWDIGAHEFISQSGSLPPPAPEGLNIK